MNFRGTFTALVTPFKEGEIDFSSLDRLLKAQLEAGISGFVVNGTTAESPTLSTEEVKKLFQYIRNQVGKDVPLILGTGSNCTQTTIENSQMAKTLGADAVLVVVPYYNKPPQRGLYAHFRKVAETVDIPLFLYNVPGRTITTLELDTIESLAKVKGIIGIKEASGKADFAREIYETLPRQFILLSGDDGSYVEFLNAGGQGVISVASHIIPRQMIQWKSWVEQGEVDRAREDIRRYSRLIDMLFVEANPIPVKKALEFMGIIDSASLRLPLVEHEERYALSLKNEMQRLELIP